MTRIVFDYKAFRSLIWYKKILVFILLPYLCYHVMKSKVIL